MEEDAATGGFDLPSNVIISGHPVLQHKMTLLRDKRTTQKDFRNLLSEVTFYLGYEATASLNLSIRKITTPVADFNGVKIENSISLIPILRAGLGMVDAMLELLPNANVHHIGMFRNKGSDIPIQYYNRLPKDSVTDIAYILDPLIATANTVIATCSILKKWGAKQIIVVACIATLPGLQALISKHPDITIHVASIDASLTEDGLIYPGLGDAGDRQFYTKGLSREEQSNGKRLKMSEDA